MELIKKIVNRAIHANEGAVNPVIEYETKSHYGGDPLIYVTSAHKKALEVLTGQRTITLRNKMALEELGFIFKRKE